MNNYIEPKEKAQDEQTQGSIQEQIADAQQQDTDEKALDEDGSSGRGDLVD